MNPKDVDKPVHSTSPSAARVRRHRNSRRSGMRILEIPLTDAAVDALVVKKYLDANERADANAVEAAIRAFVADELGPLSRWRNDG